MTDNQTSDDKFTLEKLIDQVLSDMEGLQSDTPEFAKSAEQLTKLYALKPQKESSKISKEAILNASVSLGGILAILYFEKAGVVTSKAVSFVKKIV